MYKNITGGMIGNIIRKIRDDMEPIYELHATLRDQLHTAAEISRQGTKGIIYVSKKRSNVADVFVKLRHNFLSYAPFLDLIVNANKAIDLLKLDSSGRKDLENIDSKILDYATSMGKSNLPTNLNSLLIRPVQHIMRYRELNFNVKENVSLRLENFK